MDIPSPISSSVLSHSPLSRAASWYLSFICKSVGRGQRATLLSPLPTQAVQCSSPSQSGEASRLTFYLHFSSLELWYKKISTGEAFAKLRLKAPQDRQSYCTQTEPTAVTCHEQFCKTLVFRSQGEDFVL